MGKPKNGKSLDLIQRLAVLETKVTILMYLNGGLVILLLKDVVGKILNGK